MSEIDEYIGLSRELLAELNVRKREIARFNEPVAIVGMACRFPGGADLSEFWQLLDAGASAVTASRPYSGPGLGVDEQLTDSQSDERRRWGGFIREIDSFDAEFFRIAPVEARLMDPQQRLLLETSWEALEESGIDPGTLQGTRTGVVAGICSNDYRDLIAGLGDGEIGLYMATGNSDSTAIGRIAFTLGLQGPAIAVDTACSSSLVAVHQAAAALQRDEADLVLAGGVSAILSPVVTDAFREAGMLSPDGRCKTFDAAADGYVRGEGCGVVVLKRLSDAEAAGDRIWGVIRGSAVNQDGASAGLTVPNGPAQERVIEEALARAGSSPSEVDYLEAHGTGTELGDPIEVHAAAAVYGKGRDPDRPLLIGSVKTNIGHLEGAAGIAGLIKVALSMSRGLIPKHLHFREPNPRVDWERIPVRVTAEATSWPAVSERPARAGVSSFGYSGTNAHIIVEAYRGPGGSDAAGANVVPSRPVQVLLPGSSAGLAASPGAIGTRRARFLPLSGKSAPAVRELAARYLTWLDERTSAVGGEFEDGGPGELLADMAWTASVARSHFDYRAAVVFEGSSELQGKLAALADASEEVRPRRAPSVAFVFTGQGSQWVGMGQSLYESEPVVRAVLDRCDSVIRDLRGVSLLDVMFGTKAAAGDLDDTAWTQPALYALQTAQVALWASLGVRPIAVLGHSVGELAAAEAAGVWSLDEGLGFAAARGESMSSLPSTGSDAGAMAAVFSPAQTVAAAVSELNAVAEGATLSLAADNGTHQVVSGPLSEVEKCMERFAAEGVRVTRLNAGQAFHSELMEPVLDDLETALAEVSLSVPSLPLVSNVTGRVLGSGVVPDRSYWRRHAREPVAFADGVGALASLGVDAVVEIGPQRVLGPLVEQCWPSTPGRSGEAGPSHSTPVVLTTVRRSAGAEQGFVEAAARLYEIGARLSFEGLFAGENRRRVPLPTYPFQRRRYWIETANRRHARVGHPLLGIRRDLQGGEVSFETTMFVSDPSWLNDHRVFGLAVAPGALHGTMALAAAGVATGDGPVVLEDLRLHEPLVFPDFEHDDGRRRGGRTVQVVVGPTQGSSSRPVEVFSKGGDGGSWALHAAARAVSGEGIADEPSAVNLDDLKAGLSGLGVSDFYRRLANRGIEYGSAFRMVKAIWSGDGEALGEVALSGGIAAGGLRVHPTHLDGCFQVLAAIAVDGVDDAQLIFLPIGWERMWLARELPDRLFCHARLRPPDGVGRRASERDDSGHQQGVLPEVLAADLRLFDGDGAPLGTVTGFTVKRASRSALLSAVESVDELLYEVAWRQRPHRGGTLPASFLAAPAKIRTATGNFKEYLSEEDLEPASLLALQTSLERLSGSYALAALHRLGWEREEGAAVVAADLRVALKVVADQERLFHRIFGILAEAGVLKEDPGGAGSWIVAVGSGDALPRDLTDEPERLAATLLEGHPEGNSELGLLSRCGAALADVLRGREDPVALLFAGDGPNAADLYAEAPSLRAANRLVGDVVATAATDLPEGRKLRLLEVGAGTGSTTAAVLEALPAGRFEYVYTDVSAGFFAAAEDRFGSSDRSMEYRVLDIEADPSDQGFTLHGFDLVIAANVLHATRDLGETLRHCRELLAPDGELVALEALRPQGWLDLTFGLLEGWWRFGDGYRTGHALAGEPVWREALSDAGFVEVAFLGGVPGSAGGESADQGCIVARGPLEDRRATWVLGAGGIACDGGVEAGRSDGGPEPDRSHNQ